VVISASQIDTIFDCPRRWFLSRPAAGEPPRPALASVGSLLHRLVQDPTASLAELTDRLAEAWPQLEFPATWSAQAQWDQAVVGLARYDAWRRASLRTVVDAEVPLGASLDVDGPVAIHGRVDRLERDDQGRCWIVDFKTGRSAPTKAQAAAHTQLGLYQLALQSSGAPGLASAEVAGAELIYLRHPASASSPAPKVFVQPGLGQVPYLDSPPARALLTGRFADQRRYPSWVHQRVAAAADQLRRGGFPAVAGPACRGCAFRRGCPVSRGEGAQ
jgi:RecB family exonuclease